MPTAVGPNTKGEENLVFGYDLGDSRNSYKGEPTTNLLSYTTEFDSWTKAKNSGTTPTVTSNTSPNPLGLPNAPMADTLVIPDDGTYPRIQQYFTPSSTNQHTMSVWIRSLSGDCDCFLGIFRNSPWNLPGSTVVAVTSEWQKFSFTMTPPDTTTHVAYIGSHDTAAQKGNTLELWGAMIQESTHPTPFTAGTRSATQGLIDLTGNSTIDLSNVSFDSNAQITFDGTDDRVDISPRRQFAITDPWTTELVFKPTNGSDTSWNGLFGGALSYGGYWMFHSAGNLSYYEGSSGATGTKITYRPWSKANTFTTNNYHHLTIVYTPLSSTQGSFTLYYNGGEKTDTFTWTFSWSHSLDMLNVGAGDGRYGTNDVHYFKQYNKALTASEIKANYNAIKGRFNI